MPSTFCFIFVALTFQEIYQTVQICILESSLQEKEKRTSLDNKAPSHVICSLHCLTWQRSCQSIQLTQLLQTGLPSSGSLACAYLSMCRSHNQPLRRMNTLQVNLSSKHVSHQTRDSMTAKGNSSTPTRWFPIYESSQRNWKSPFESRRTDRMVSLSLWLLITHTQIYARSKRHIVSSSDPKDWTS